MIEFRCTGCRKLLRTTDDKAGLSADCPSCGTEVTVPAAGSGAQSLAEAGDRDHGSARDRWPASSDPAFPAASASAAEPWRDCPMCGGKIAQSAPRCPFCGEQFATEAGAARLPQKVDAGEVLSTSWAIYKQNLGILVGVFALLAGLLVVTYVALSVMAFIGIGMEEEPGFNELFLIGLMVLFAFFCLGCFLGPGIGIVMLKIARGQPATAGELFAGGRYFPGMLGNTLLLGAGWYAVYLLTMMLLGPRGGGVELLGFAAVNIAIILMGSLVFWPYGFILVDRNPGGIRPLIDATRMTRGNYLHVFLLWLASFGLSILGSLALVVGLLFAAPLASLLFAVAYCRMAGHATARAEPSRQ